MKSPAELRYITIAQIIGCSLVILGHSIPFVTTYPYCIVRCINFLYTFHMPLFVWCSGFLFCYTKQSDKKTFSQYFRQRSVKLLVPYFAISMIGLIPKILTPQLLNDTLNWDWMSIVRAFIVPREGIWGHFWFLPMIYLIGLLGFFIDTRTYKNTAWLFSIFAGFICTFLTFPELNWFAINDIMHFFVYYALGVIFCKYNVLEHLSYNLIIYGIVISVLAFYFVGGSQWLITFRNFFIAVMMIISIVLFCKKYEDSISIDRKSLIAQTYQIFILSWPCQLVAGIIVERILHLSWTVFIPVVFITGVAAPLVLLKFIDWFEATTHTRVISFVLGR